MPLVKCIASNLNGIGFVRFDLAKGIIIKILDKFRIDGADEEIGLGELMGKDSAYYGPRISQIIERYLGKGHKIADATLDQVELISLIVTDVREDLFKQK